MRSSENFAIDKERPGNPVRLVADIGAEKGEFRSFWKLRHPSPQFVQTLFPIPECHWLPDQRPERSGLANGSEDVKLGIINSLMIFYVQRSHLHFRTPTLTR